MKKKMQLAGFKIEAEIRGGLLFVSVGSRSRREVLAVDFNSEKRDGWDGASFSDNPHIVDCATSSGAFQARPDGTYSPTALRRAGKDPVFRAWWIATNKETPEQWAARIETRRRMAAKQSESTKIECGAGGQRSGN